MVYRIESYCDSDVVLLALSKNTGRAEVTMFVLWHLLSVCLSFFFFYLNLWTEEDFRNVRLHKRTCVVLHRFPRNLEAFPENFFG